MASLEPGDVFEGTVDRISQGGNAIVNTHDLYVNVGPISEDAVGETIEMVLLQLHPLCTAYCLSGRFLVRNYSNKISSLTSGQIEVPEKFCLEEGEVVDLTVDVVTGSKSIVCDYYGVDIFLENVELVEDLPARTTIEEKISVKAEIQRFDYRRSAAKVLEVYDRSKARVVDDVDEVGENGSTESSSVEDEPDRSDELESRSDTDLSELEERAEEDSVEQVSADEVVSKTVTEYSRSQAVKDYVKARADGECEGCEEPAPFRNPSGEPYLHAHHVQELSKGGSDTQDTVIALCPNCHYRVHHGRDGEEYNQELIRKLADIQDVSVKEIADNS